MHEGRPLRFNDVAIPVAYIDCDEKNDNDYWISLGDGSTIDATSFLDAVFGGRFKFGLPGGRPRLEKMATVELWAAPGECWNEQCRASMDVLLEIVLSSGNRTVKIKDEPVPGYPKRLVARDDAAAGELKKRTLTNLYNARPQWLADAHAALDSAVAAAYGWGAGVSEEEALRKLLASNAAHQA